MTETARKRRKLIAAPNAAATAPVAEHRRAGQDAAAIADYHVAIETSGGLTVGRMVIDTNVRSRKPASARMAVDADTARFGRFAIETLSR